MSILSHLCDQDTWTTPFSGFKCVCEFARLFDAIRFSAHTGSIHALNGFDNGLVATGDFFDGFGDLTNGRFNARGFDREVQQIAFTAFCCTRDRVEGLINFGLITVRAQTLQLVDLHTTYVCIVDLQNRHIFRLVETELVHAHHCLNAAIDTSLRFRCGFLDAKFRQTFLDGFRHTAHALDFFDVLHRATRQIVRQAFHVVRATPRVDQICCAAFLLQEELRVAGDAR